MAQGILLTASETVSPYFTTGAYITVLVALLSFLAKHYFNKFDKTLSDNAASIEVMKEDAQKNNTDLQIKMQISNDALEEKILKQIRENDEKTNKRICKMEDEINGIKKEYGNIKGDFATMFLQRDDFFRFTNGMENNLKEQSGKIDRVLFMIGENRKN